jgi:hypothetical protein
MYLIALYAEDTYKLKPNLTVMFGLRWEYVPAPDEAHGRISTIFNPTPETSPGPVLGGPYFNASKRNFAPRLGFNWDPFNNGKTSVRGGFGIFYNEIEEDSFYGSVFTNPPFATTLTLANVMTLPFSQSVLNTALANGAKQTFGASIAPNTHTPTKYGYNLTVQQELPGRLSLMVAYVGAQSRWLGRSINWQDYAPTTSIEPGQVPSINGVPITYPVFTGGVQTGTQTAPTNPNCTVPGQLTCLYWAGVGVQNANVTGNNRPTGTFSGASAFPYANLCTSTIHTNCFTNNNFGSVLGSTVFDANAFYNSLQVALERRVSPGLYMRFNYTFAKCIADSADDLPGGSTNGGSAALIVARVHNSSRGRCTFLGTNAVNFTLNYDIPFGRMVNSRIAKSLVSDWQFSTLTTVSSGTPFNITDGLNLSRNSTSGAGSDRPNWAPGCNPQNAVTNPHNASTTYVNANCFVAAVPGYQGNVGASVLTGPALWSTDLSLKRSFPFKHEGMALTLGADMFNAFNRANFSAPTGVTVFVNSGTTASPVATPNRTAGQILSTVTTSRQFQISGRFVF